MVAPRFEPANDVNTPSYNDTNKMEVAMTKGEMIIALASLLAVFVVGSLLFCLYRRYCRGKRRSHDNGHVICSCSSSHSGTGFGPHAGCHGNASLCPCGQHSHASTASLPPPYCSHSSGIHPGASCPAEEQRRHLAAAASRTATPLSVQYRPSIPGGDACALAISGYDPAMNIPSHQGRQQSPAVPALSDAHAQSNLTPTPRGMIFPSLASVSSLYQSNIQAANSTGSASQPTEDDETQPMPIDNPDLFHQILFHPTPRSVQTTVAGKLMVAITRQVGPKGDHLILDDVGISLIIPPGAVTSGKRLITLILDWDLNDAPGLGERVGHVSPVVCCYPHGFQLQKACLLRFKHCAFDPRQARVLTSETDLVDQKQWRPFGETSSGDATPSIEDDLLPDGIEPPTITGDEVQISIRHFTLFTCVQFPPEEGGTCRKWIQVVAFAPPLQHDVSHYQIRVYFLNKTPCALQWAIQNEAGFGHTMVCPEKVFLCEGGGQDMCVRLSYVSPGWEMVGEGGEREGEVRVKFLAVWHNKCPYTNVCLRRSHGNALLGNHGAARLRNGASAAELSLQMAVFQDTLDNEAERLVVHVIEPVLRQQSHYDSSNVLRVLHVAQCCELEEIVRSQESHVMPYPLKVKLSTLLDPTSTFGHDWREMASMLELDHCIHFLEFKAATCSPTISLLTFMEERSMTLADLRRLLEQMGRLDALRCLEAMAGEETALKSLEEA